MADPELAAVESALNTLALAETESALQRVITRLLPALLTALSTKSTAARNKCIETLHHISVRLRALPNPRLPFAAVLSVATAPTAAPLTTNVAIQGGYIAKCFNTLTPPERAAALPTLLSAAATVAKAANRDTLHRLALDALHAASTENPSMTNSPVYALVSHLPEETLLPFFTYGLRALRQKLQAPVPEAHLVAIVRLCSEYAGVKQPARAARVFPHLLVAAGTASRTALCAAGEDAMKKVDTCDVLAAEDPSIAATLFELFADPLADIALRVVLLSKGLLRVTLCASCFPEVLDVISASLHTPGIPPRMHALGMQFVSFVVTHSAKGALESNAEAFVNLMMKLLNNETDGSPSFPDKVRAFGYTGLADMLVRVPSLMGKHRLDPELFFQAAQAAHLPTEVRAAAAHALVMLTRVVRIRREDAPGRRKLVLDALFRAVHDDADAAASARAAAVQWANECFSFADCEARLVNIVAAADLKEDVRQHAAFGLSAKRWRSLTASQQDDRSDVEMMAYPDFRETVEAYATYSLGRSMRPKSVVAYLTFGLTTLKHAIIGTDSFGLLPAERLTEFFAQHSEELLTLNKLRETADDVLKTKRLGRTAGMESAALAVILFSSKVPSLRKDISAAYSVCLDDLIELIEKKSAAGDMLVARATALLVGIASETLSRASLLALLERVGEGLQPNASGKASGRYGEDERVAKVLSLGQIITSCLKRPDFSQGNAQDEVLSEMCMRIMRRVTLAVDSADVVRAAACSALGDIGVAHVLPIPLSSRAVVLSSLSGLLKLHSSDARLTEAAADAIGRICVGEPRRSLKRTAVEALLHVCRERKEEEIRFTASESLVRCASGFDAPSPASREHEATSGPTSSKANESEDLRSILAMKFDKYVVRDVLVDDEEGQDSPSTVKEVIAAVVRLCRDERPNARAGGCVCLFTFLRLLGSKLTGSGESVGAVSFVSEEDEARCSENKKAMSETLPEIQQAFTMLLGDRSDFVQQLASCGVALVYEMCPPKEQRELVSTLVRSLTSGKSKAASTVPGDQGALLEIGGVNTAEPITGGRAATYKELCSLAQDMGQPELVYKFMDLAGHTALWNSRRGAALAGSALLDNEIAAEQLRPHLKNLLPRLYVYCHDPTDSVRVAMGSVLNAVVKASGVGTVAEAISQNFELVTRHCLTTMISRQWRNREAACGALRDLLVSKTWEQVGSLLSEFWYITLRVLDDIKESVRKAAEGTGRALSELSVHLCDPKQVGEEIAAKAISTVIPAVLPAFTHAVAEVRLLATQTLTEVIRLGGKSLTPSVPDLVEALLEAATELEPQVLNYAEFHVEDKEQLQKARVDAASMSASPLIDSLERLSGYVDESIVERLIPKLVRLSRIGVGIPTRAATARFFATILRSRAVVVEPFSSRLMFAATAAAGMERNMALRSLWCTAVGAAAKLSQTEDVGKLVDRIVEFSGSEDAQERSLASSLAVGLWRKSPDTARKHASAMLPIAYMGRYETDEDAKGAGSNWKEVWGEGAPSTEAGLRLYAKEITQICEHRLATSTQYRVKRSAAAALGALAGASNESVDIRYLAQSAKALLSTLPGHIWDGKVVAVEALGTIAASYSDLEVWTDVGGAGEVVKTLLGQSRRGKKEYRLAAIEATVKLLTNCRNSADLFEEVREAVEDLWKANSSSTVDNEEAENAKRLVWETGTDASAVDARNKARKARKALCIAAITCIEAAFAGSEMTSYQARRIDSLVAIFESSIKGDWEVRHGVLQALQRATSRVDGGVLLSGMSSGGEKLMCRITRLAEVGVVDAKYAVIRRCGLQVLENLGRQVQDKTVVVASFSEVLVSAILQVRAADPDPSTQGEAKKVCSVLNLNAHGGEAMKTS